jgi:uncharacterized coiled-coil DUF342 family protein
MKIKHKVIKEFQYLSPDKKIFVLKSGTVLEEYNYRIKSEVIPIDKEIIDNNPEFFEAIDWKAELMSYMKLNKMPQPAQLGKKLIPFIEEMVLSSIQAATAGPAIDEAKIREVERKEADLASREKRIRDKEEEIEIRLNRVEKREAEHKEDMKALDRREDELRERSKELTEKALDLDDRIQDLNEKERNLDRTALDSSKDIDEKYAKLQEKIDSDLKAVTEKERSLEKKAKEIAKKEEELASAEEEREEKSKKYDNIKESVFSIEDISKIVSELAMNADIPPHIRISTHNDLISKLSIKIDEIRENL